MQLEVAPKGGPPLHVHHNQEETIHALKGRYKVQIGDETFHLAEGGFAYLPSRIPHAFLNLTDEPGEIVVVYVPTGVPAGGHKFYEELGPLMRKGTPDHATVAALFKKYDMTVLGPPLTAPTEADRHSFLRPISGWPGLVGPSSCRYSPNLLVGEFSEVPLRGAESTVG